MKKILLFLILNSICENSFSALLTDFKLTDTETKIKALDLFLKKVSQPVNSFARRIKEYKIGFTSNIRLDTNNIRKNDFITSFLSLIQAVLKNNAVTIEDLNDIYKLFFEFKENHVFSGVQKNRFSSFIANAILRRKEKQNLFRSRIGDAISLTFSEQLNRYKDLFSSNFLDSGIVETNKQRLVNAVGRLTSFIVTKKQKLDFKKFCEEIVKNKFLSDPQKKQINNYIAKEVKIAK